MSNRMSFGELTRNVGDVASLGTFLGWVVSALPVVALVFTVIWCFFRVIEMKTTHVIMYRLFGIRMDEWLHLPKREEGVKRDEQ